MKVIIKDDHASGLKKGDVYENLPDHVAEGLINEGVAEEHKPAEQKEAKQSTERKTKEEKAVKQTK